LKVEFRESFRKDLRSIKDKNLLAKVRETIESLESAAALLDLQNIRNFAAVRVTIASASVHTVSASSPNLSQSSWFAFSIGKIYIATFHKKMRPPKASRPTPGARTTDDFKKGIARFVKK
jgi:hypothetical protein